MGGCVVDVCIEFDCNSDVEDIVLMEAAFQGIFWCNNFVLEFSGLGVREFITF